ncbi:hypothetical protein RU96_GL002465 [Enterococcus canintestini]|uniref:Uncharacterized protein n=1 Tax=Enterococcus canintestini TaxID=317010 RepID=A0A1L8R647_9ENTE|nr:hypothetical protein RU96_GL002465 [Enterococcus canintestini]
MKKINYSFRLHFLKQNDTTDLQLQLEVMVHKTKASPPLSAKKQRKNPLT